MKLKKRGNGYFYIYYDRDHRKSLKTIDKDEASKLFNMEKELLKKGQVIEFEKVSKIKLSTFKEEYLNGTEKLPNRKLNKAQGTVDNDDLAFRRFMSHAGDIPLRSVTQQTIDNFKLKELSRLSAQSRSGDPKQYINILLRCLRAAFNASVYCGYINKNPFQPPKGLDNKSMLFNTAKKKPRSLNNSEIAAYRSTIQNEIFSLNALLLNEQSLYQKNILQTKIDAAKEFGYVFEFAIHTGLRRAELLRLRWQDIDFQNNKILVVCHATSMTKDKEERYVPLHPDLKKVILQMSKKDIGNVFTRWTSPDTISRLFKKYADKAEIRNKTLHKTRHTFGTHAVADGVDIRRLQRWMGHSDIKTTMIYVEDTEEDTEAIGKINFGGSD